MTSNEFTQWMDTQVESLCVSLLIIQNEQYRNADLQVPSSFLEAAFLKALLSRFVAEFGREPDEMASRAFETHLHDLLGRHDRNFKRSHALLAQ